MNIFQGLTALAAALLMRKSPSTLAWSTVERWLHDHARRDNYGNGYAGNRLLSGSNNSYVELRKESSNGGVRVIASVYHDPRQGAAAKGTEYWLSNLDEFKSLSHIASLQEATSKKIEANGGAPAIVEETKKSIILDVLSKQLPIAVANDEKIGQEVEKLDALSALHKKQLASTEGQISDVRVSLRQFVTEHFSSLIVQAKGASLETFTDFFEREIGAEGVVLNTCLQNAFDQQLGGATLEVNKMTARVEMEINHFNDTVKVLGKQGLEYVIKSNFFNPANVLAARNSVVNVAKVAGLDLGKLLQFKPWGAVNFAKGANGLLAVLGLAMEAWDSWEQAKREDAFRKSIDQMVKNLEKQRVELLDLINGQQFIAQFFPGFIELKNTVSDVQLEVETRRQQRIQFHAWREMGDIIDAEFSEFKDFDR
jgi:hypothetical protein